MACGYTFFMKMKIEKPWSDVLFFMGITVAVYIGVRFFLPLVYPFLFALFFASLLHPIVNKIQNKIKIPRGLISFVVVTLAVLMIGVPLVLLFLKLVRELGSLIGSYKSWKGEAYDIWCMCCERVEQLSGIKATTFVDWGSGRADSLIQTVQEKVTPVLMKCSIDGLKGIAGFFWRFLVAMVATVLMLNDYPNLRRRFFGTTPGKIVRRLGKETMHAGGSYLKAQLIILAIVSTICVIGLFFTGNKYALTAGIGIGLCDALPFLGTGTVFVPWLLLKLIQGKYILAVVYGLLYIICNIVREFLEPKLVGKELGIHPLAVIFSIYVGMCVYGGAGIILGPLSGLLIWELYRIRRESGLAEQQGTSSGL